MNRYTDANIIFKAGDKAIETSKWKFKSQEFEMNQLLETAKIQKTLEERKYKANQGDNFIINERGKLRNVTSVPCVERTVNHLLCDEVLTPELDRYLIHDNGASRDGKGVSFHRKRFEQHVHEFYRKHGNEGYILLGDFKSYYASIDATIARRMAMRYLSRSETLTSEELEITNYILHEALGDGVGINIGGQPSQNIGILFATGVDQLVKTVHAQRYYARYSDDFYCIHYDREYLKYLREEIEKKSSEVGLRVHPNKTYIARLDRTFTHLQVRYKLTESGKLVKRIKPETITRERHRLKAYRRLVDKGRMSNADVANDFKSWMYQNYKVMSQIQIRNIYNLYLQLFDSEIVWKTSKLNYFTRRAT